jgi:hypothetical protein
LAGPVPLGVPHPSKNTGKAARKKSAAAAARSPARHALRSVRYTISTLRAAFGPRVVPCVASYPRRTATREGVDGAARLRADLERTGSRSAYVWSAASLDDAELDVLHAWAKGEA